MVLASRQLFIGQKPIVMCAGKGKGHVCGMALYSLYNRTIQPNRRKRACSMLAVSLRFKANSSHKKNRPPGRERPIRSHEQRGFTKGNSDHIMLPIDQNDSRTKTEKEPAAANGIP